MSDLADQIDDYICTFDGVGDLTMDTLAMFLFGWALLALFLLWLCKFLYNKYVKKGGTGNAPVDTTKFGISPSERIRRSESKEISASKDIKVCVRACECIRVDSICCWNTWNRSNISHSEQRIFFSVLFTVSPSNAIIFISISFFLCLFSHSCKPKRDWIWQQNRWVKSVYHRRIKHVNVCHERVLDPNYVKH